MSKNGLLSKSFTDQHICAGIIGKERTEESRVSTDWIDAVKFPAPSGTKKLYSM